MATEWTRLQKRISNTSRQGNMKKMDLATFLRLVEKSVEAEPGTMSLARGLDEIGWDSIAHLSFIAEADRFSGMAIDPSSVAAARTVADLYDSVWME